jgi:hypothetical protein
LSDAVQQRESVVDEGSPRESRAAQFLGHVVPAVPPRDCGSRKPEVADKLKFASLLSISIFAAICSAGAAFLAFFRSRAALQFEILALRHQLGVLQRSVKRPKLTAPDRLLWAWLSAVWRQWQSTIAIVKPATVIGWTPPGLPPILALENSTGQAGAPRSAQGNSIFDS